MINKNYFIEIEEANLHNLKNVTVKIPRNKLTVITGLSGSGKSTLAFDTLYAEGQRKYVESLSSYSRQFLGKIKKPKVKRITGLSPAIAIEQKVKSNNPRSTVGTSTEIYDFLKLLFSRIGKIISPLSGNEVKKNNRDDILNFMMQQKIGHKFIIMTPMNFYYNNKNEKIEILQEKLKKGFQRVLYKDEITKIEDLINNKFDLSETIYLIIDRLKLNSNIKNRIIESIDLALIEGEGKCIIENIDDRNKFYFDNLLEMDGIKFEKPNIHLFSFNSPFGSCETCSGFGEVIGIDEDLVVPNKNLSVFEDAIFCWRSSVYSKFKNQIISNSEKYNFPIHKPYKKLNDIEKNLLWLGSKDITGIYEFFKKIERKKYKIQNRVLLSRYRNKTTCKTCNGFRLRKESTYVKINNYNITDLLNISIKELYKIINNLKLNKTEIDISRNIIFEIKNRLKLLIKIGLSYLTINRKSSTLSGGESQRINIITSIGSSLVGSIYVLDEPSIGLHSIDTLKLIEILQSLKNLGNTVVVVEHDEEIIKNSDYIIDIGPKAGKDGGEIIYSGNLKNLLKSKSSLTAKYLNNELKIELTRKRSWKNSLEFHGIKHNNLKNINVKLPLNVLNVIIGVSGSGKSTLVKNVIYPCLLKYLNQKYLKQGNFKEMTGDIDKLNSVTFIDQNPIGRSSRSNPVTYIKAYDEIRNLFSKIELSKIRKYKPKHFSFNVDGGRCEECLGEGEKIIEMQFMADIKIKCEVCKGKRFKKEILDVRYFKKNIFDILNLTVNEAIVFFESKQNKKIVNLITPLKDVGLGYINLGQSSSTLSGGEAQRVKLASFLGNSKINDKEIIIFDEPTTGLHIHDIRKLLNSFKILIEKGHTILVVEHNIDVIKTADWIIELGEGGGEDGGNLIFEGQPENLINNKKSLTSTFLNDKLKY
tara:strand:- start:2373 stop:5150 length:2778 start_codon:yes stop_codon:yes gene_type:complete